jgi:hypothetical protein
MTLSTKGSVRRLALILLALAIACSAAAQKQGGPKGPGAPAPKGPAASAPREKQNPLEAYTIEQSVSEKAQLSTIAFSALAFMTGSFGADTFLPPGKAADYFGFQYMRDIDVREAGHNMMFLTNIANNTLAVLSDKQRALLLSLAAEQEPLYAELARKRLVLIEAFRENMEGKAPAGSKGLSQSAVEAYVSGIFAIDGELAFGRARTYGAIVKSLSSAQKAAIAKLKFGDSSTWPELPDQVDKRSMTHDQDVLFQTYASEFFSWYAGSETADVYFCPERHGTYFGGFYMKDYPAMGQRDYFIPTALTGDSGQSLIDMLAPAQAERITSITTPLAPILEEILGIRRSISREFRKYLSGGSADEKLVMALSKKYGELDGRISYMMADRFAAVYKTLSSEQKSAMVKLRNQDVFPEGYYLYADPVKEPLVLDTSSLFSK